LLETVAAAAVAPVGARHHDDPVIT
jgi:hypothetical protein